MCRTALSEESSLEATTPMLTKITTSTVDVFVQASLRMAVSQM